jgi:hypothetical protein
MQTASIDLICPRGLFGDVAEAEHPRSSHPIPPADMSNLFFVVQLTSSYHHVLYCVGLAEDSLVSQKIFLSHAIDYFSAADVETRYHIGCYGR